MWLEASYVLLVLDNFSLLVFPAAWRSNNVLFIFSNFSRIRLKYAFSFDTRNSVGLT